MFDLALTILTLAQDGAPGAEVTVQPKPWWHLLIDNALALTILFLFITAIVSLIVNQRKRDKCLKLLGDFHVSFLHIDGKAIWGDLIVFAQGVELVYDAAYRTRRGVVKTSSLVYEAAMPNCLAICRSVQALSQQEKQQRDRQIRRSYRPNMIRRALRWFRNIINTLKDAFSKSLSLIIGQISKTVGGKVLTTQQSGVDQVGQTLLGAAGNAYMPILERHIGKPVVLQLQCPAHPDKPVIDLPGYLVDYTDKYVAIFNVSHEPVEDIKLDVTESIDRPGVSITREPDRMRITCAGPDVLIVKSIKTDKRFMQLDVALTMGCFIEVPTDESPAVIVQMQRTRRVDIVAPRTQANILFGGDDPDVAQSHPTAGVAPEQQIEDDSDDPVDEQVSPAPTV